MAPALAPGDYLIVDARAYAIRAPAPGEIVIARDPRAPARALVKRVAALDPGGGVVLLGDNREESSDSRVFGALPLSELRGRALWRYWPPSRFGPIR